VACAGASELGNLEGVGEVEDFGGGGDLDRASDLSPVGALHAAGGPDLGPWQRLAAPVQPGLVRFHREYVVPAAVDDVRRGGGLCVHSIGRDYLVDQVKRVEQGAQGGDLVALEGDLHLSQDDPEGVVQGRDQVRGAAPGSLRAAHRLGRRSR